VQVFTTGRGTPYGLMAVPVIKMATRTELAIAGGGGGVNQATFGRALPGGKHLNDGAFS
jgi:hypothetical protein